MGRHSDDMIIEADEYLTNEEVEAAHMVIAGQEHPTPPAKRHCAECGTEFTPKALHQRFCQSQCRLDYGNREQTRGQQLLRAAYHWRRLQKEGQEQDAQVYLDSVARQLDSWAVQDAQDHRKAPLLPKDF